MQTTTEGVIMYSGASNTENYLNRTGSYSLRFRRSGDNSDLAGLVVDIDYTIDIAGDKSIIINDLMKELSDRKKLYKEVESDVANYNKYLSKTLTRERFEHITKSRKNAVLRFAEIRDEITALKNLIKEKDPEHKINKMKSLPEIFFSLAEETLPPDIFNQIKNQSLLVQDKIKSEYL